MSKHTKQAGAHADKAVTTRSRGKIIGIVAVSLVVLLVAGAVGFSAWLLQGNGIYQGVHVGEVDVSGMSRRQALDAVTARYAGSAAQQDLAIKVGDQTFTLSAEECPVSYNVERAVTAACQYGHQGNIIRRIKDVWNARQKGACVELPLNLDETTLQKQMDAIAQAVKVDYRPSGYSFVDNTLTVDKGHVGYGIDATKLAGVVRDHLMAGKTEAVEVALGIEQPLALDWDAIAAVVKKDPQNPYLDLEKDPTGGTVVPGKVGYALDVTAVKAMVEASDGPVVLPVQTIQPEISNESFKNNLFRDLLGSASSTFSTSNKNRTTNVKLAAQFCNNVVLMPGDEFSYNTVVGPRTIERGFKEADIYVGSSVEKGLGGGICQVTSTIYLATLYADMEIVERSNHSRDVSYVPDGLDATVAWGSKDFRFKNNSEYPVRVQTTVKNNRLTVEIYGTQTVPGKEIKMRVVELSRDPAVNKMVLDTSLAPGTQKASSNVYDGFKTQSYRQVWINGVMVSETKEAYSSYKRYDYTTTIRYNPAVETPAPDADAPASGGDTTGGTTDTGSTGGTTGGTTDGATDTGSTDTGAAE